MKNLNGKFDESLFEFMNNNRKSMGIKSLTKKEYLKSQEETNKRIKGLGEKMKYCKEHGHFYNPDSEHIASGADGTMMYGICTKCNLSYKRKLTTKEWGEFHKMMNTPMTI